MKKRWLVWIMAIAMTAVLLTGCSGDRTQVRTAAEGFLQAIVDSDADAAGEYASEEFLSSDQMAFLDANKLESSFYASMGINKEDLDETAQETVSSYINTVVANAYQSYDVGDIKLQDGIAYVTTEITLGYDPEASSEISEELQEEIEEYQSEHYDELVQIYLDDGEEAMYKSLYNGLIPIIISDMQEQVDGSSQKSERAILTLEKVEEEGWLITAMEEDPADSDSKEGSTAETTGAAAEEEPQSEP